jgi:hypothetical protein
LASPHTHLGGDVVENVALVVAEGQETIAHRGEVVDEQDAGDAQLCLELLAVDEPARRNVGEVDRVVEDGPRARQARSLRRDRRVGVLPCCCCESPLWYRLHLRNTNHARLQRQRNET